MRFEIKSGALLRDGAPFQLIGGAMHYFRIPRECWHDRLLKLKQCGLNAVETYVCWNLHERREGSFDFSGGLDIAEFAKAAGSLGLMVIVRPGPYICAEWDFGGLPPWLLMRPGMRLRADNGPFLEAVDRFFARLMEELAPLQSERGGPIVAMQIENEYGCFGSDKTYLRKLKDILVRHGASVQLLTSDPAGEHFSAGALPEVPATINFRNDPASKLKVLRKLRPEGPDFVMEYWSGSSHVWGGAFHRRDPAEIEAETCWMLANGASFSFYMFHGGTNFGFMNGARVEANGDYSPYLTSYDVDAPLNEAGDPTEKYFAIQRAIAKSRGRQSAEAPKRTPKKAYGTVRLNSAASLFDALPSLSAPHVSETPEPMERFGQGYGFILYRSKIEGPASGSLAFSSLRDRAQVFLDGRLLGIVSRNDKQPKVGINLPEGVSARLDILVENQGRVNCGGQSMLDGFKGICGGVSRWGQLQGPWEIWPLPLDSIDGIAFGSKEIPIGQPAFYQGFFDVDEPADSFIKIPVGEKGACWINGFNVGRYWNIGPQRTLYVPGSLLKKGRNAATVLELHGLPARYAEFVAEAEFSNQAPLLM